ncbi:MAG: hypothetical protein WBB86_00215 [Candidatus Omnitrophota bacterium]
MPKTRYELDPHNRLVLDKAGRKTRLMKFRKVLDGRFRADNSNNLSYHIKTPVSAKENIPHQLRLKGKWSLTDDHDLCLTLDKQGRETFGDKITLRGNILDVKENSLLFAVTTKTKKNTRLTYILELGGTWKADKNNRLSFHIKKEKGKFDILTFKGAWDINKDHQIIYRYEKAAFVRKKKKLHTLTFKGHWNVTERSRISYELRRGSDSAFDLKTSAGIFKGGNIKYELGIGLSGRPKPVKRTVTLFGKWKLKKNVGLVFEVDYRGKKPCLMVFGADARLTDKDTVLFKLRSDIENRGLGVDLKLSRKMLEGDGEAFLRLLGSKQQSSIYAGAAWKW